jgi:hypothetical protein
MGPTEAGWPGVGGALAGLLPGLQWDILAGRCPRESAIFATGLPKDCGASLGTLGSPQ